MKLDASHLRYLEADDFRVLSALEAGSKNYELVPIEVISRFTGIRPGGLRKRLSDLSRHRLFSFEQEGIRLGYGGYDYLALNALLQRGSVVALGNQIGVGKESDIYLADQGDGTCVVIKIQRLGRTSFRSVKMNRDYHGGRKHISWLYLSRLASQREFEFMKALWDRGFSSMIPKPIDSSRHIVVMERIIGRRLDDFGKDEITSEEALDWLHQSLHMLTSLAKVGLIHGDLNEFNIMVRDDTTPNTNNRQLTMIDFPQMISINHENAIDYFTRDLEGIVNFFRRVFDVESPDSLIDLNTFLTDITLNNRIDIESKASGFRNACEIESEDVHLESATPIAIE
jgi:RIO kinase 2